MRKAGCFAEMPGESQNKNAWLHVAAFIRCLQIYDTATRSIKVALWRHVLFTMYLMRLETELLFPGPGKDESG